MKKITEQQINDIGREVFNLEVELSKYLSRKIAILEENIGLHIGPIIDDRRSYACDSYSLDIKLNTEFNKPSEHTRRYLPKEKNE